MAAQPPFAVSPSLNTKLSPLEEFAFRDWVKNNRVPFDPDAPSSDYDMRGFYQAQQQQSPLARSGVNENDVQLHYTDYFKAPSHKSFSSESQWADQNTPQWVNDHQLASPNGRIQFDERAVQNGLPFKRGGRAMPLTKSASPAAFKSNVKAEMAADRPQKQALAIAFRVQRDAKQKKMAKGGRVGYAPGGALPAAPFQMRSEARDIQRAGMIHSPTAGRADKLPMGVKAGAFVVPADVVSGLGQGNSMAGGNALSRMMRAGPFGSGGGGAKPPSSRRGFADGGDVAAPINAPTVPILASGGEYIVDPESVARIGGGSLEKGHDILDSMVQQTRKKTIKTLKRLPKPRKR